MIQDTAVLTPQAQPGGLLTVAREFPDELDWRRGVIFSAGTCLEPERDIPCPPDESPPDEPFYQSLSGGSFKSFQLRLAVACTTRSRRGLAGFADESLRITTEFMVGAELQDGLATGNPNLDDAAVVFSADGVRAAIGCLEAYGASILQGRQLWLHVPPGLAVHVGDRVDSDGGVLRTAFGSIVVISPGYTGTRIFATGDVWAATAQNPALEATNRSNNTQEAWGDGEALVAFDPCFLAAAETGVEACEMTSPGD